ncbi:MAG: flagellar hook-associated protein FlgK [Bdellovibrionales bacterium]|nr:flagellar hook-associated protein FlgK [Bdellovibrionales bacterium]
MPLPNVMQTGKSGMVAAKAQMATTSHNISNANTEGYSRQRVQQKADNPTPFGQKNMIGQGTLIARTERINDNYIEKQIRSAARDLSHMEEKDLALKQTEDIFNEMGGEGLNRVVAKFFNEFRKLANEPDNEAVRQSVRESTQAVANDFHRLRGSVEEVRTHLDSRIEGFTAEANALAEQVKDLNLRIKVQELSGAPANDLRDQRDLAMKKLSTYVDTSVHLDKDGAYCVDIKGVGPLVNGPNAEKFGVYRSPADEDGKPENSFAIRYSGHASDDITHALKGGKIGALLEVRDQTLSSILNRLDELASAITESVNAIHREGVTRYGTKGVDFFKPLAGTERASAYIGLSDAIANDVNQIAAGAVPDAPGDNRIAVAISQLQNMRVMDHGNATVDSFYNGIVSDVGVVAGRNRNALVQQKDISMQLDKMREQISGVSMDEETANLLQYQRAFDASAKVISVADQCLETVLNLRR